MRLLVPLLLLGACVDPPLVAPRAAPAPPSAAPPSAPPVASASAPIATPPAAPPAPAVCQESLDRRAREPRRAQVCAGGDDDICLKLGLDRVEGGDLVGAVAPLEQACRADLAVACRERALLDAPVAGGDTGRLALLDRACQKGDGEGCHVAAVRRWIKGDTAGARRGLGQGCELGFHASCGLLGWMHDAGEGGRRDVGEARRFYEKSSSIIDLGGCHRLASHVAEGPRSGMSMCDRGLRGCAAGCSDDCGRQAARLRHALNEPIDEACRVGRTLACVVSALTLSLGESAEHVGRVVEQDSDRARDAFLAACQKGMFLACDSAAIHVSMDADEHPERLRQAADLRARGCQGGDSAACVRLGQMIEKGEGRPKDARQALTYFERACSLGSLLTCHDLAAMYREGDGVQADAKRADAFERAARGL